MFIANEGKRCIPPSQTLTELRIRYPERTFGRKDIYNARQRIRIQELNGLTPTQALMEELNKNENWPVYYNKDQWDRLDALFFTHPRCIEQLRKYPYILFRNMA